MKHLNQTFLVLLCGGICLLALTAISQVFRSPEAKAQSLAYVSGGESIKEIDDKIRLFFDDVLNANGTKAFEELLRGGPLGAGTSNESVASLRAKLDDMKKQFGDFKDYDKIDAKSLGKDTVVVRYILKCESHPVVWVFSFYRRPLGRNSVSTVSNPWFVIGLRFDTNLELLTL